MGGFSPKVGRAISRFVHYKIFGGEEGNSCCWWVATNKDTDALASRIYKFWPSHFDASLK